MRVVYCDETCRRAAYRELERADRLATIAKKRCLVCDGPMPSDRRSHSTHCSDACKNSTSNPKRHRYDERDCPQCGKRFRPFLSHQVTCSYECRAKGQTADWRSVDRTCARCGTAFRPNQRRQKYCRQTCAWAAQSNFYDRVCECCGKAFVTGRHAARFCSKACITKQTWKLGRIKGRRKPWLTPARFDKAFIRLAG